MRTRLFACCGAWLLASAAAAQLPVEVHRNQDELLPSPDTALAANKKLVFDFWRHVIQAHEAEHAPAYLAEGYVEHEPSSAAGSATLIERASALQRAPVKTTIDQLVTIIAERDLVVLAFRRTLPDLEHEGQTYTTTWFEMFRVTDGKIVEHWNYSTKD